MARGWLSFAAACGIGAVANLGASAWLLAWNAGGWKAAALAGAAASVVWNFALSSRFTWSRYR